MSKEKVEVFSDLWKEREEAIKLLGETQQTYPEVPAQSEGMTSLPAELITMELIFDYHNHITTRLQCDAGTQVNKRKQAKEQHEGERTTK